MAVPRQDDFLSRLSTPYQFRKLPLSLSYGYLHGHLPNMGPPDLDYSMDHIKGCARGGAGFPG